MRKVVHKAVEIVNVSAGLYLELARSALQLVPRRRRPRGPLAFARTRNAATA